MGHGLGLGEKPQPDQITIHEKNEKSPEIERFQDFSGCGGRI